MSDYTISIPDPLYQKAQRIAQQTARPLDEVIRGSLEMALDDPLSGLPSDEQAELKAMAYLSDDALFGMLREQLGRGKQERLSALMQRNDSGDITKTERNELAKLVEDCQRLTLRKATAMDILLNRGHSVTLDDMTPDDA